MYILRRFSYNLNILSPRSLYLKFLSFKVYNKFKKKSIAVAVLKKDDVIFHFLIALSPCASKLKLI